MTAATESVTEPASTAAPPRGAPFNPEKCATGPTVRPPRGARSAESSSPSLPVPLTPRLTSPPSPTHTQFFASIGAKRPRRAFLACTTSSRRARRGTRFVREIDERGAASGSATPRLHDADPHQVRARGGGDPDACDGDVPAALRRGPHRAQRGRRVHGRARREAARHRAFAQGEKIEGGSPRVASRRRRLEQIARQGSAARRERRAARAASRAAACAHRIRGEREGDCLGRALGGEQLPTAAASRTENAALLRTC